MTHRLLVSLFLALPLAFAADAGADDSSATLSEGPYKIGPELPIGDRLPVNGPVFKVYSEHPDRFDFVGNTHETLTFVATLSGFCSGRRRAEDAVVTIAGVKQSKYVGAGPGTLISERFVIEVPQSRLQGFDPVQACNDALRARATGSTLSREQWVQSGLSLRVEDVVEAKAVLECQHRALAGQLATDSEMMDVWVHCVGAGGGKPAPKQPGPKPPGPPGRAVVGLATPPKSPVPPGGPWLHSLRWRADNPRHVGRCPAELSFHGSITTTRAGMIRYRIRAEDGSLSEEQRFMANGPGVHELPTWTERIDVPSSVSRVTSDSATQEAPAHRGWRRLEITYPPGLVAPVDAHFEITCRDEAPSLALPESGGPKPAGTAVIAVPLGPRPPNQPPPAEEEAKQTPAPDTGKDPGTDPPEGGSAPERPEQRPGETIPDAALIYPGFGTPQPVVRVPLRTDAGC